MNHGRTHGDDRIYEEDVDGLVSLSVDVNFGYVCDHMQTRAVESGHWERFYLRLTEPHPTLGVQVRRGSMCCACYYKLRAAGAAPRRGTWEGREYPEVKS